MIMINFGLDHNLQADQALTLLVFKHLSILIQGHMVMSKLSIQSAAWSAVSLTTTRPLASGDRKVFNGLLDHADRTDLGIIFNPRNGYHLYGQLYFALSGYLLDQAT